MRRRVTPDVQALVQGMISRKGPAGALLDSWSQGETQIITCEEIVSEFERVLKRSHIQRNYRHLTEETIATIAAALRERPVILGSGEIPRVVPDDPDDDVILACAAKGRAEYIVSRDRHLLRLGSYQGIRIVSAESFAHILRGQVSELFEFVYGR